MKICKHCKMEIDDKAKVCPHCRKKQKRGFLPLVLVIVAIIVIAMACSGENDSVDPSLVDASVGTETTEQTTEQTKLDVNVVTGNEDNAAQSGDSNPEFEEIVVVDNDNCAIKITGIDPGNIWGYSIKIALENKSTDKTYMYAAEIGAVNGVQFDPFYADEVMAGKKSNGEINISRETFEKHGITEFTDIELSFRVYDTDDWEAEDVAKETVHVYPLGKENAVKFTRESQPNDNIIIDNNDVTVVITGYTDDEICGYSLNLYLVNKTNTTVMYSVEDASVNGYMLDPFWADSIEPGKCAFSTMTWSSTALEENNITDIEEIEIIFRVYDEDNWDRKDFANEKIVLNN